MSRTLFTQKGAPITLGRQLGRGGEGAIHEVTAHPGLVAKVYHVTPDSRKQAKLAYMAATSDATLVEYVAWPQLTLHPAKDGPVLGFVMPKVADKSPIHMVYSPAHRRQDYPKAAWDFLVFVARNIAASFETVHSHGHVIGDVNQDSVMVGKDSRVILIDSDSFQVNANGSIHLCRVGVPFFTPPELQTVKTFSGLLRTANHDNFGLALLIFHVLFGGRHPFAGIPQNEKVGEALEVDIQQFRYAYARDNRLRANHPPPRSIPITTVPDAMEAMFHLAFTEKGASGGRPTASQWKSALDSLRSRLRKCKSSAMHCYPNHLTQCPWCGLEQQGVAYFIDLGLAVSATGSGFVLTAAWARIEAISPPSIIAIPNPANISAQGCPLPSGIPGPRTVNAYRVGVVVLGIVLTAIAPKLWILVLLGVWLGFIAAGSVGAKERDAEKSKRNSELKAAQEAYDTLVDRAKREGGSEAFNTLRTELRRCRQEWEEIPRQEKRDLDRLQTTARERQMQQFLDRCFIDKASIPGLGPARKAALRSFGIETADDVAMDRIMQIRGFGEGLTRAMLDWRASCERRFSFNPARAVTPADLNAVKAKHAARRIALEAKLTGGPGQLQHIARESALSLASLQPLLDQAAHHLAQAKADATVFK